MLTSSLVLCCVVLCQMTLLRGYFSLLTMHGVVSGGTIASRYVLVYHYLKKKDWCCIRSVPNSK